MTRIVMTTPNGGPGEFIVPIRGCTPQSAPPGPDRMRSRLKASDPSRIESWEDYALPKKKPRLGEIVI